VSGLLFVDEKEPSVMTILKKAGLAIAAATMTIGSTAAVAAPARADVAMKDSFAMGENASSGAWIGILAVAALVGIFLFAGSQTDAPSSP
jgi:hypothetical protein